MIAIRYLILLLTIALCSAQASSQVPPVGERLRNLTPPDFAIGGVLNGYKSSFNFLPYRNTASREFNAITAAVFMPYGAWADDRQPINTSGFLRVVDWAHNNGMRVHGHTLIYPTENVHSAWLQALPNNQVEAKLRQFVSTLAASTAGRVWVWDVVNEVIGDNSDVMDADGVRLGDFRNGTFKPYKEYQALGQAYIAKAFQWAREADPNALLILNEYAAEEINPKSDRLLAFCKKLKDAGVPIDGVGFQHHWIDTRGTPDYDSIRANMQRFGDAGFKIFVTEADIAAVHSLDPVNRPPNDAELERQKSFFQALLGLALEQPACKGFFMWDFVDDQSWMQGTDRPLLWDTIPPGAYMFGTIFWGGDSGGQNPIIAKRAYYGLQETLSNRFIGPCRLTSGWDWTTSYMVRSGTFTSTGNWIPGNSIFLNSLNDDSETWQSMKWHLERMSPGVYRIRCDWGGQSGYLTRAAFRNSSGVLTPAAAVQLTSSNPTYLSQQWRLIPKGNGGYNVVNAWGPSNGLLTREAAGTNSQGQFTPSTTVKLHPASNWTSQIWYFSRVE